MYYVKCMMGQIKHLFFFFFFLICTFAWILSPCKDDNNNNNNNNNYVFFKHFPIVALASLGILDHSNLEQCYCRRKDIRQFVI